MPTTPAATSRHDLLTRLFHWATMLLIVVQFALGWTMPDADSMSKPLGLMLLHVDVGVLLLLIAVPRLFWSGARRGIAPVDQHPALALVANATHKLLYLGLIVVPLLGWLNANGRGWTVGLGQSLALPTLAAPHSLGAAIGEWHSAMATAFVILIGLHACAALAHRFVMRDGVLDRMF
ncbi:cytochrome b [Burkholderia guangdongensis]|uniref:cytochrome b n=1 Tax=Burkholderia guangdongensis TaxID=1792500 RepID=UPI0015CB6E33|nr:cytochrome b/b6 domain-containing protein [Burkholderia guangdongensis]